MPLTLTEGELPVHKTAPPPEQEEILREAKERFQNCVEAESSSRNESLDDLSFKAGEQWPENIRRDRNEDGRPCLVINRLPGFSSIILNEFRQSRPSLKASPKGDGASRETAEIIQGILRHIEVNSDAAAAYDTAIESAIDIGFGYFRVLTDYERPDSFDQEIFIERIPNSFTVYFGPHGKLDASDAEYAFVFNDYTPAEFKAEYGGDGAETGTDEFTGSGDQTWFPAKKIRVVEYWRVVKTKKTLYQLESGQTCYADKLLDSSVIVGERETATRTVEFIKLTGKRILERVDWPGEWIPILPVYGEEIILNGQRRLIGMIRNSKDPQRQYNYMRSAVVEMIALAPRVPFLGAVGQFEGHELKYQQANRRNMPYLEYNPKSVNGVLVGAPQRQQVEPPIQAASMALAQAENDMKATTMIFDASLGQQGPEQSGKAIMARQRQGNTANYGYVDNFNRTMNHLGRILLNLIPKIYSSARIMRIIKPDGSDKLVPINQKFEENGIKKLYDVRVGRYDVVVSSGPGYQTRRQEAADTGIELVRANPGLMSVIGDLVVKNFDWPLAQEISDRLKKMLPPQLQEPEEGKGPNLQQMAGQLEQAGQMIEQLTQRLNEATQEISTKRMELDSKERIASMQVQADLIKTESTINAQSAQALLKVELEAIRAKLDALNSDQGRPETNKQPSGPSSATG